MAYCKKCGAYIPIGETACPACGYDPEAEGRAEKEAEERRRREAARKAEQERTWAAQEKKREEEERRRREEEEDRARRQSYGGSAAQGQYASRQQTQNWVPPWSQEQFGGGGRTGADRYADAQRRARESVDNQNLSVLSYLGPLFLIPLLLRRDDRFARFHANQGLVLFLTTALLNAVTGWGFFGGLFSLAVAGFNLYCIVKGIQNVVRGKMEPLPIIGSIRLIK